MRNKIDGMNRSERLDRLAKTKGLSLRAVAHKLGLDPARLSEWKRGDWRMPVETGVELARILGVTVDYLVTGQQDPATTKHDDAEIQYLLRVIADAGLNPAQAVRELLRPVRSQSLSWTGAASGALQNHSKARTS